LIPRVSNRTKKKTTDYRCVHKSENENEIKLWEFRGEWGSKEEKDGRLDKFLCLRSEDIGIEIGGEDESNSGVLLRCVVCIGDEDSHDMGIEWVVVVIEAEVASLSLTNRPPTLGRLSANSFRQAYMIFFE